jgi:hypothetical protein
MLFAIKSYKEYLLVLGNKGCMYANRQPNNY